MNDTMLWWSASQWQAVGTIVLVLVTIWYAWHTRRISKHAGESATSAEKSAQSAEQAAVIAERGLALQTMPLVFGHKVERTGGGRWQVTLFSAGTAPAFNLVAIASQGKTRGDTGILAFHDPTRGPRELDLPEDFGLNGTDPYEVEVSYHDALGNYYRTRRTSLLGGESMTSVDRWDEHAEDWVSLV